MPSLFFLAVLAVLAVFSTGAGFRAMPLAVLNQGRQHRQLFETGNRGGLDRKTNLNKEINHGL